MSHNPAIVAKPELFKPATVRMSMQSKRMPAHRVHIGEAAVCVQVMCGDKQSTQQSLLPWMP